jgi:hypothetical protein
VRYRRLAVSAVAVVLLTFVSGSPARAASATFSVSTTLDSGVGSLRQAILDANSSPGADSIDFAIPGSGVHVITLASALPAITEPVSIDARTQSGWISSPLVEIDQAGPTSSVDTLTVSVSGTGSSIAGLAFINFFTAIAAPNAAVTIADNWIGLHADGTAGPGVRDNLSNQPFGVEVGPGSSVARNIITNGGFAGISICHGAVDVVDNRVGVGPDGAPATSTDYGILFGALSSNCDGTVAPGTVHIGTAGHGNFVGGAEFGIFAAGDVSIIGNTVGFGADGVTPNPDLDGIGVALKPFAVTISGNRIGYSSDAAIAGGETISNNIVGLDANGGPAPNHLGIGGQGSPGTITGNDVANSDTAGVAVVSSNYAVRDNRIHGNGGLGIDLGNDGVTPNDHLDGDTGPNGLQNFPVITSVTRSASTLTVRGTLDTTPGVTASVDLYQSPACDPSGNGEGAQPRGGVDVVVPQSGVATWQQLLPVDDSAGADWTATATTSDGTSEFSACSTDTNAPTPAPTLGAWQNLGGGLSGAPAAASPGPRTADIFIHGLDDALWHTDSNDPAAPWTGWASLGGILRSSPAVAGNRGGALDIVVRGMDDGLWTRPLTGSTSSWQALGGLTHDSPAVAHSSTDNVYVFVRGVDDAVWFRMHGPDQLWTPWQSLGGVLTAAPAVTVTPDGEVDVVVRGSDGGLWLRTLALGGPWSHWTSLGGGLVGAPAIASMSDGTVHVFVRGLDNQLWHRGRSANGTWSPFDRLGGLLADAPGAAGDSDPNRMDITIAVHGVDGHVWLNHYGTPAPTG